MRIALAVACLWLRITVADSVAFFHRLLPAGRWPRVGDTWDAGPCRYRVVGLRPGVVSLHDGRAVVSWERGAFERATARWILLVRG